MRYQNNKIIRPASLSGYGRNAPAPIGNRGMGWSPGQFVSNILSHATGNAPSPEELAKARLYNTLRYVAIGAAIVGVGVGGVVAYNKYVKDESESEE